MADSDPFRALLLPADPNETPPVLARMSADDLPEEGSLLVRVSHSSLNFKDAMAITGRGKIVRAPYPFVPGIDLAGEVIESRSDRFSVGDLVIGTGGGLGETRWGGFSELERLPDEYVVALPEDLVPWEAMAIGTAGLTAMLALEEIERYGLSPDGGPVIVTGATGGVGSFAVLLLTLAGYSVTASTGKEGAEAYLRALGASSIIHRSVLEAGAARPLDSATWAGGVDTVGGSTLEAILSQTARRGGVAACGLAGGPRLHTTVYPFILRGVGLLGIDSNTCPLPRREAAWKRLARSVDREQLSGLAETIPLEEVPSRGRELLEGSLLGRTVVDLGHP